MVDYDVEAFKNVLPSFQEGSTLGPHDLTLSLSVPVDKADKLDVTFTLYRVEVQGLSSLESRVGDAYLKPVMVSPCQYYAALSAPRQAGNYCVKWFVRNGKVDIKYQLFRVTKR